MQDHETCSSLVEPDPITESPQSPTQTPDPITPSPPLPAPIPQPQISDLDLPIALRKGSCPCPSTRNPLDRFCSYTALSTDHHTFTTSLDSYSVLKNVTEALHNPGWFRAM